MTKQFANKLNCYFAKSLNYLSKTISPKPQKQIYILYMQNSCHFPFKLTKKHVYEVNIDSLILSHQLHDQGGMPHEDISEAGQHMFLAHQLRVDEEKCSIATKSQPF